ncbi:MAG: Rpn family recombination-promoting nuclease/putative transposase [Spirochaetaceae bacterium]|jgi:predicted transposase/invertase (TIGR01784 family)|nr:Rpn family recombination-promoting nuclease/putative transposase [Spirochaetaceae bacterium]
MTDKIRFDDADDVIDICLDNVFKAVFTRDTPASQLALSKLVSALIGREVSIIAISANEPPIDNLRDRQIRFDINCKAENGELVNVEMSLNPDPFEPVRLEYYMGKLFTGQDVRGIDKSYNDLQQAYQIAILAKEQFFPDEAFFHVFEYYDQIRRISLNGKSCIITLELSKLEKVVEKPIEEMDVKEYWAIFFKYLNDKNKRGKINEIMEHEEGIAMASKVLMTISKDETERARLMSEYKYQMDTQSKLVHAKRMGIQEGMEKGRREIINLLKNGKSPEEIIKEIAD